MPDAWTITGSLAAAGGTFAAAFAIWQSSARARADSLRDDANSIRQELKLYNASLDRYLPLLISGDTLLAVAETISSGLIRHSGVQSVAELRAALERGEHRISLLSHFILSDPAANALRAEQLILQTAASNLGARLPIFSDLTLILMKATDDSISAMFFIRFLGREVRELLLSGLEESATVPEIENFLGRALSSNAAMYFAARFDKALRLVDGFSDRLIKFHLSLSDAELRSLVDRVNTRQASATITDSMKAYLQLAIMPPREAELAEMLRQLDEIRSAISKEAAASEVQRLNRDS